MKPLPSIESSSPEVIAEDLDRWLQSTEAYEPRPPTVERIETHISRVFVAGDYVYKLKKPVKYDFLDFSTLQAREHACHEEVRLNRRLAKEVYLGVVPVTRYADGRFELSGRGEVVDWLVKMRRLPAERMLDAMHHAGTLGPQHIDRLAQLLANFYAGLSPVAITADAYRQRCLAHVHGNLNDLLASGGFLLKAVVQRVNAFQLQLLQFQPQLFEARVQAGRIVEGHGDLRAEHVCLTDTIAIFDCIEFNEEFRQLDVADEMAFLAAECDYIGAAWVGPRLLQRFQHLSGDHPPPNLVDFYKSYRAAVRAKVAAIRANQLSGPARDSASRHASVHLELADRYAAPYQHPVMLMVGGHSGSGKTTLARELAQALSAELIRSDVVRQELFGSSPQADAVDRGRYEPEARQRVYEEMFHRAAALHRLDVAVVLDATFSHSEQINAARALAAPGALFLAVECRCRPEVAMRRIAQRNAQGDDASEATPQVLEQQLRNWKSWPAAIPQMLIDTEQPLTGQVQAVLSGLARHW